MNQLSHWILRGDETTLGPRDRSTHTYVIGQPGTGKSRALESWIMQDIRAGHGVGVIDPHGDLFQNLLIRLSSVREVWERVVIIDPCNKHWITLFNPLEALSGFSQERMALFLTDIMGKIWKMDLASAPRSMWLLSNTFLALSNLGLTLLHLPKFLLDQSYRESLMPRMSNPAALSFFQHEYPQKAAAAHQWATPVLNKIGGLIFDPDVSLMLAGKARVTFRQIMDRQMILLVNIPKGILGEGTSALIGAFIVAHLQKAALARANTRLRHPFYLYLDEFQNYTSDNIQDILSESRKYALSMTLVNQYLEQLNPEIRHAILNTAGSIVSFRMGHADALQLAKEMFAHKRQSFADMNHGDTGVSALVQGMQTQNQNLDWDALAESLTRLPSREFWQKRRGLTQATRHRTFDMPLPEITAEIGQRMYGLVAASHKRFGRPREIIRQEVDRWNLADPASRVENVHAVEMDVDEAFPVWGV